MTAPEVAERALVLRYARPGDRAALAALFSLDDTLAAILRTTREPLIGQMRLTWWREALDALDRSDAPAEPVLQALSRYVITRGVSGAALAVMIDGWEELTVSETLENDAILRFSQARGEQLFAVAGVLLGASANDPLGPAGGGWALADLARHVADPAAAREVAALAEPLLDRATASRWSRPARPLGALTHLAKMDLQTPFDRPILAGSPRRTGRVLWHRVTGR